MSRLLCMLSAAVLISSPMLQSVSWSQEIDVSHGKLHAYPEKYVGKVLTFTGCSIDGKYIERQFDKATQSDFFAIGVTLAKDGFVTPIVGETNLSFACSAAIGDKLFDRIPKNKTLTSIRLTCRVAQVTTRIKPVWVIMIDRIE